MTKEERFNRVKKALKMTLLTGTAFCMLSFSLTGCLFNQNYDVYNKTNSENSITEEHNNSQNDIYSSRSYNSYLYDIGKISLSDVIKPGTYGIESSKYTDNADRRLEQGEYTPIPISITQANYETFATWVKGTDVKYVYADLYDIDYVSEQINDYASDIEKQGHQHSDLITSIEQIPTTTQIYDVINKNTENYLKSNHGYYKLDESYIKTISELIVSILTNIYDELEQTDIERIYCMLKDVVVIGIDSSNYEINDLKQPYNARVTEDGVVLLDTEQISQMKGENTLERTIAHEITHLFQRMCPDHQIKGFTQIGSSQYVDRFDETKEASNSLHFQWLYEAAAEEISMNEFNAKTPLVYENMVGYLNTLDLITLIRPEYKQDSIAISQMSTDPNKIYEVFGAETEEEKKEIAHMLFSICYIQTARDDFATIYTKVNGSISGKETTIKKIMKESVAQTMTKYFYINLAERVTSGEVQLQDVFYLINTFEAALNRHIIYDDEARYEYNDEVLHLYIEIQNRFFEIIAESSNLTYDEIIDRFNNYALVIQTDNEYQRNYSLGWLSEEEKTFIGDILTNNISSLTTNIRNINYIKNNIVKSN